MGRSEPTDSAGTPAQQELERLREENRHLRIIGEFATSLLSRNSLEDVLWHLTHDVVDKLGFEECVVYLRDGQSGDLVQRAVHGPNNSGKRAVLNPIALTPGQGIVGAAAKTAQTILIADTSQDSRYIQDDQPRGSELAVPLLRKGAVIGVIDSEHSQKNFFGSQERDLMTAIAAIASTRIDNSLNIESLEQTVKQLEHAEKLQRALFDIAQLSFTSEALPEFYSTLHDIIGRLVYAENFYVAICDLKDDTMSFGYFCDVIDHFDVNAKYPLNRAQGGITAYLMRHRKPLLVDTERLQELHEAGKIQIVGTPPVSWMGAPFYPEEDVMGAVVVQSYDPAFLYSDSDKDLLAYVSNHISAALQHQASERKLHYQALHDPLTGLANRLLFLERLGHALERMARAEIKHAVLFLDLDKFKAVNDSFGHGVGDELLIKVGSRILGCLRKEDTLARLGGDEFAVLLEDTDPLQVVGVARRISNHLQRPMEIQDHGISISSSVGAALIESNEAAPAEILERADSAMYQAKKQGPGHVVVHDQNTAGEADQNAFSEHDIATGMERDEFELYYQPILHLDTGMPHGLEALLRWNHPELGLVYPNSFIPIAESSGLIVEIDRNVLKRAAGQIAEWQEKYNPPISVSVNLSGQEFSSTHLVRQVAEIYRDNQLQPGALCLELTETALIQNLESAGKIIRDLHQLGAELSLDDFGTGYSSLSYLHRFHMHTLKIDRSFVATMNTSAWQENPIINTIIALGKALDMRIVAEGVETEAQQAALLKLGCDLGQGYLFAKPMPKDAVEAWLDRALSKTRK